MFCFRPEISQADPYHAGHLATRRGRPGRGYLRRRRGGQPPGPEIMMQLLRKVSSRVWVEGIMARDFGSLRGCHNYRF